MTPKTHRAEVIEVYKETGQAAVKFRYQGRDRIECVRHCDVTVGDKGTVRFGQILLNAWGWSFEKRKVGLK